jgi:N-acetylglucosaminyl-diphospho-decaprenol L-rhamnosyltransferase
MSSLKPMGSEVEVARSDIALTIVISCYNTRELVRDCLTSIYENPPREVYEIILVDDACTDGTSAMVCEAFPEVRLLRNAVNRHYTYSNNRGIDQARGTYVLLLNNDTIVLPQALDTMIDFLRKHPEAGAVGCRLLNEDGTTQASVKTPLGPAAAIFGAQSLLTKLFPKNRFSRRHVLHIGRDTGEPFVAGFVSGAASMMPLKVMRDVGRLDESFFYHVDADYCKRIGEAGYKCFYLPTAAIIHLNHKGGSMANPLKRLRSLMMFEVYSYRYYRKHFLRSSWDPTAAVVALGLTLHFLGSACGQVCTELVGLARSISSRRERPAS